MKPKCGEQFENESSDSYCMFGTILEYDDTDDDTIANAVIANFLFDYSSEKMYKLIDKYIAKNVIENFEKEKINSSVEQLIIIQDNEMGTIYFGRPYVGIGDEETGFEFKESAKNIITEVLEDYNKVNKKNKIDIKSLKFQKITQER